MRDPNNPFRPYSIPADDFDRERERRRQEEEARKEALHKKRLEQLSKPIFSWKPLHRPSRPVAPRVSGGSPPLGTGLLVIAIYLIPILLLAS